LQLIQRNLANGKNPVTHAIRRILQILYIHPGQMELMKQLILIVCLLASTYTYGQALRDINYNYEYGASEDFSFLMKPVRAGNQWGIGYRLQLRDTSMRISDYTITWEMRRDLNEKDGSPLSDSALSKTTSRSSITGNMFIPVNAQPAVVVAKVIHQPTRRAWIFYRVLESNYPVTYSLRKEGQPVLQTFVSQTDILNLSGTDPAIISFYNDAFPVSQPPFSESQGRVSKGMKVDSAFTLHPSQSFSLSKKGLYLIQKDTMAVEGLTVRAEDDYPRLGKIASLAGPMVYICTKQEFDRLSNAKVDKKQFDKVILGITNDTDRARKLIRNYFRRVELANQYFTSYKEGWKSDRGMIYIVFGVPDQVYKFHDREVWYYDADLYKVNFTFLKSPSLFDPDNYVLIRDKKYQQTWYEVIDLWRNARF
jgi:GWxTD domain-containing protein